MNSLRSLTLFALVLISLIPLVSSADLYDQRAAEAARYAQMRSEQNRAEYLVNIRRSQELLAYAFGLKHGGVQDVNIIDTRHLRFNSGDGYACEAYISLSYFECFEPSGRGAVRFRRDEYVVATQRSYFDGIYLLASAPKPRRHR